MSRTGQRYKDVLLALATVQIYGEKLGRLQMQKLVYLVDSLSLLWGLLSPAPGFQTYKHGPYDPAIQNAIDVLTFRGAINIVSSEVKPDGSLIALYEISDTGIEIVRRMKNNSHFSERASLYETISNHVSQRGWGKLRDLVYSEATYIGKKADGWGTSLNTNSLLSNDSLRTLLEFNDLVRDRSLKLGRENLTSIFFRVLDNYLSVAQGQG